MALRWRFQNDGPVMPDLRQFQGLRTYPPTLYDVSEAQAVWPGQVWDGASDTWIDVLEEEDIEEVLDIQKPFSFDFYVNKYWRSCCFCPEILPRTTPCRECCEQCLAKRMESKLVSLHKKVHAPEGGRIDAAVVAAKSEIRRYCHVIALRFAGFVDHLQVVHKVRLSTNAN